MSRTPTDNVTVATKAQKKLRHIVLMLKLLVISYTEHRYSVESRDARGLTSTENKTPPIGEPNATATPAALAAVRISLIFPKGQSTVQEKRPGRSSSVTHHGSVRSERTDRLPRYLCSMRRVRRDPPCRLIGQRQLLKAKQR